MTNLLRVNLGGTEPPRLRRQHSFWALGRLPMNALPEAQWTTDEKFAHAHEAGFEAIEVFLNDANEAEVCDALTRQNLRLVAGHRPFTIEQIRATVERAVRRKADFVFAQPADAFMPLDDVVHLIIEGRKIANDAGLPFFVETHRNNFTENLPQTLALIERVPEIRFTGDLSHFVVVGEFYGWAEEKAIERMRPVLERVVHLHGRISNGEQVQVDVGDGTGQTAQFFVSLWAEAMRAWRKEAGPGDVFPFTPELGPPRYAITLPDGSEFSDRWEQSLVVTRLAEQAWEQSANPPASST